MYDLKICLKNGVDLFVVYDKQSREIMISLHINGVEVLTTEEPVPVENILPKDIKKDLGIVMSDLSTWLSVVDRNPNFEKSTVWERN